MSTKRYGFPCQTTSESTASRVVPETGETIDLDVDAALLARYRQRFEKRLREVRAYLRGKRVRHVLVETAHAEEPELLRQLLREGVLR